MFLVAIFIAGCCPDEPMEETLYLLVDSEKQLIPYQLNETISFKHSGGFEFDFMVVERSIGYDDSDKSAHRCPEDYSTYEYEFTSLKSNYPRIELAFSLKTNSPGKMYLSINRQNMLIEYDSAVNIIESNEQKLLESIEVNNKTYYSVIYREFYVPSNVDSVNSLYFKSFLYNKQYGLIQLKTSKNETYSIF